MAPKAPAEPGQKKLADDKRAALALTSVGSEAERRLDMLVDLLLTWQRTINLVAPSTLGRVWTRHVADSLQLIAHAPAARVWVDLGSGAGFPGLAVACALPAGSEVHLVESDSRKAAFLREAARITGAPAHVHKMRIEDFSSDRRVDLVTARALAPMARLLDYAAPFLEKGAQGLFLKGQDVEAELTEAAKSWHMEAELVASITEPRSRIVRIRALNPLRIR